MSTADESAVEGVCDVVYEATKAALVALVEAAPGEHFYYFSLTVSDPRNAPILGAISHESLERAVAAQATSAASAEAVRSDLRWSYADSPYWRRSAPFYAGVQELFARREAEYAADAEAECELRFEAMERAMRRLDAEGAFGVGLQRTDVVVGVEEMPPSPGNTLRMKRLNPPAALVGWLAEAAEPTSLATPAPRVEGTSE